MGTKVKTYFSVRLSKGVWLHPLLHRCLIFLFNLANFLWNVAVYMRELELKTEVPADSDAPGRFQQGSNILLAVALIKMFLLRYDEEDKMFEIKYGGDHLTPGLEIVVFLIQHIHIDVK